MKTLVQYIEEKLIVNKDFKNTSQHSNYNWDNVDDFLFVVFNNDDTDLYLDISHVDAERGEFTKEKDNEYHLKGAWSIKSVNKGSVRGGNFIMDESTKFLYEVPGFSGDKFSTLILHPKLINNFKDLIYTLKSDREYESSYILKLLNIETHNLPENYIKDKKYSYVKELNDKDQINKEIQAIIQKYEC